jgi:hypothetical protein
VPEMFPPPSPPDVQTSGIVHCVQRSILHKGIDGYARASVETCPILRHWGLVAVPRDGIPPTESIGSSNAHHLNVGMLVDLQRIYRLMEVAEVGVSGTQPSKRSLMLSSARCRHRR